MSQDEELIIDVFTRFIDIGCDEELAIDLTEQVLNGEEVIITTDPDSSKTDNLLNEILKKLKYN
jgi:hypothetical protein